MLIKEVIIENIRSYIHQTFIIPEGSTLLSGDIGSGKSTLLHAIEFAFFGLRGKQLSGPSLLRSGAQQGSVEILFEVNKKDIRIKRFLKRTPLSVQQDAGYIIENDRKQPATAIELKAKVLELLHYPSSLLTKSKNLIFTYTVYTPQEEMKYILQDSPDNRQDVLRKVFGFDKYKTVRENTGIITKDLREQQKFLEGTFQDLEHKKTQLQTQKLTVSKLKQDKATLQPIYQATMNKIEILTKHIEIVEQQHKDYQELKHAKKLTETQITEKLHQLQRYHDDVVASEQLLKDLHDTKITPIIPSDLKEQEVEKHIELKLQEHQCITQRFNELTIQHKHSQSQKADIVQNLAELQKVLQTLAQKQENLDHLQRQLEKKENIEHDLENTILSLNRLGSQIREAEVHIEHAKSIQTQIKDLDNCPTCLQQVQLTHKSDITTSKQSIINQQTQILTNLASLEQAQTCKRDQLKNQLQTLQEQATKLQALQFEVKNAQQQEGKRADQQRNLELIEQTLNAIEEELRVYELQNPVKLLEDINQYRIILQALRKHKEDLQTQQHLQDKLNETGNRVVVLHKQISALQQEIQTLENQKQRQTQQIQAEHDIETVYLNAKQKHHEVQQEFRQLELQQVALEKDIANADMQSAQLQDECTKKQSNKIKHQEMKTTHHWLENKFIPLMSTIEKHILITVYKRFNELFQRWFAILMEDANISVRLDSQFTPVIVQNGYEIDYNHLSGGEKTSCALAYRLALNKVTNDIQSGLQTKDIIILDEPTDGFSTEQLEKLRPVLDQLNMKQIIIVSHEPKIESFVDNVIRVHKDEHVSRVV